MKDFNTIFKDHYRPLVYFADKILVNREQAEDIVSEAFMKLSERLNGFKNEIAIKSFLYLIVKNACISYLIKQKRLYKRQPGYSAWVDKIELDISYSMMEAETLNEIIKMIERMPEKQKMVCKMAYFEGLSAKEIAAKLGLSHKRISKIRLTAVRDIQSSSMFKHLT